MSYRNDEKKKIVAIRDRLFGDPGGGMFSGKERPFVLRDPLLNLWADIRDEALAYFDENDIGWWKARRKNVPTVHVLSSQC